MPTAQRLVHTRYACRFRCAPREKNSRRASSATKPPSAATSQVGPHHTKATTAGINTAAVKTRAAVPEPALEFVLVQTCLFWKFIPAAGPELPGAPRPNRHSAVRASDSRPAQRKAPHAAN